MTDCKMRTLHFDPILDYDISAENVIGRYSFTHISINIQAVIFNKFLVSKNHHEC